MDKELEKENAELKKELNKACEWHKVTDWKDNSQFPNDETETYLVLIHLYQNHYIVCELDITEGYRQFYLEGNLEPVDPQYVIAWKEIVPPDIEED